jgi:hypothetical protein
MTDNLVMDAKERSAQIVKHCMPLYIGGRYLMGGHGAETTSATVTFVKYQGIEYAVTCEHVSREAYSTDRTTARIHFGRTVVQLDQFDQRGMTRLLKSVDGDRPVDVSICRLGAKYVEQMSANSDKPRVPIDLDSFQEVEWSREMFALAAGYPDKAKYETSETVSAPMVEVTAPVVSGGGSAETFTLHAQLETPSSYGFSGMSGGPVFLIKDGGAVSPLWIIFEGSPSQLGTELPRDGFLGENDVLIRAHRLTPSIFERWLEDAGLN